MTATRVTWTEDAAAVVDAVRAACRTADGQDPLDEAADLHLRHHGLTDARLWLAGADGFALLRGVALDLAVAPAARRRGLGTALLAAVPPGPIQAWSHGNHPDAAALAKRFGLRRERDLWVLRRQDGPIPDVPAPEGVTVRGYRPEDRDELLRVNAAAFAQHPEQGGMDAANLAERMAEPWFDPAGLLVAERAGRLLGFHWTKEHSPELGEVYVVGIDPAAQGSGLGRLLTAAGLRHLADRGVQEVHLYVEADNDPALALYRRLGFTHADADTHVMYRR